MTPPKYVFNHICLYDGKSTYGVFHKLDKRIPKEFSKYGKPLYAADSLSEVLSIAIKNGVKRWDIFIPKEIRDYEY